MTIDLKLGLIQFALKERIKEIDLAEAYFHDTLKGVEVTSKEQYEKAKKDIKTYFNAEKREAKRLYFERLRILKQGI